MGNLFRFFAAGLYLTLQDRPRTLGLPAIAQWKIDRGAVAAAEKGARESTAKMQLRVAAMPSMWLLGLACAGMSATRYAINSWGILYLQETRGCSLMEAGSILGLNMVVGIAGCAAYEFISDRLFKTRRPPVTLAYGILEVLSLPVIFYAPTADTLLLTAACTAYGFSLSGILIHRNTTMVAGVRHYDFSEPILFWVGTSLLSLILASMLWRARTAE